MRGQAGSPIWNALVKVQGLQKGLGLQQKVLLAVLGKVLARRIRKESDQGQRAGRCFLHCFGAKQRQQAVGRVFDVQHLGIAHGSHRSGGEVGDEGLGGVDFGSDCQGRAGDDFTQLDQGRTSLGNVVRHLLFLLVQGLLPGLPGGGGFCQPGGKLRWTRPFRFHFVPGDEFSPCLDGLVVLGGCGGFCTAAFKGFAGLIEVGLAPLRRLLSLAIFSTGGQEFARRALRLGGVDH